MTKFQCYDENGNAISHIYQWDTGRHIDVRGLDVWDGADVYFDFSTIEHNIVYTVTATENNGVYSSKIPDEVLMQKNAVMLYVYQATSQNENFTVETIRIPIIPRQKPNNYTYTKTPPIVRIPDGLTVIDGEIYVVSDGEEIGEGADFTNGGAVSVDPEIAVYLASCYDVDPGYDIANDIVYEPAGNTITSYIAGGKSSVTKRDIEMANDSLVIAIISCPYDKNLSGYRMEPLDWESDGWTHEYDTMCTHEETLYDDPDNKRHFGTRVFTKRFSAGTDSLSFHSDDVEYDTPLASAITIACVPFASSVNVYGEEVVSGAYEAPPATGNNRLFAITQNIYWGYSWSYSNYSTESGDEMAYYTNTLGNGSFYMYYDYHPEDYQSPVFTHGAGGSTNFAVAVAIDILWSD